MVGIKNPQRGRTFRIQSIPMSVSEDDFTTFLNGLFGDAGPHDFTFSLAVSGTHKVAAVTFTEEVPSAFGQVVAGQRMNLNTKEMKDLVVDCDFIGLTPLSTPEDATVDIVAVAGLEGDAFRSWVSPDEDQMWLRDFLPHDLEDQRPRILTFGYDPVVPSQASIKAFSSLLLESVTSARIEQQEKNRPIVFIGHNIGGLIIKQALADAPYGSENYKDILNSTAGLLFFGVPNEGLNGKYLDSLAKKGQSNVHFLDGLKKGSELLRNAHREFLQEFQGLDCQIAFFYEQRETAGVTDDEFWANGGEMPLMVTQDSATWTLPTTGIHQQIPIDTDNPSMVKYSEPWDKHYVLVRNRLQEFLGKAPGIVEARLKQLAAK